MRKERPTGCARWVTRAAQGHYQSLIGKTLPVLVENNSVGCTPHFAKVNLLGHAPVGAIVDVRCMDIKNGAVVAPGDGVMSEEEKSGWLSRLRSGLQRSSSKISESIVGRSNQT